jgi:ABC-type glycerol-3-phosphate transport system substrate-binding protein
MSSRLAIAAVVLALLVGCGAPTAVPSAPAAPAAPAPTAAPAQAESAAGPVTLAVLFEYSTDSQKTGTEAVLADFQKAYPQIKLNIQSAPQKDAPVVLQTRMAANDAPDVLFTVPARVPNLIRDNQLTDISSFVPAGYKEAFGPNLVAEVSGDKVYGFPLSLGIRAVAYNVDLFDKAGVKVPQKAEEVWTWDQMVNAAEKVQKATGVRFGIQFEKPSFDGWVPFLFQNGGTLVTADGKKAAINNEAGVGAIQWTVDLHKNGLAAPGVLEGAEDPLRLFASGQVAMWLGTGTWSVVSLEAQVKNFKYSFTFLPKQVQPSTVTFGNDVVVMKTKHPEQAWTLVRYVTDANNITRISNAMGNFPSRTDAKNITFPRQDLVPFFQEQAKMVGVEMSKQMLMPFYGASRDRLLRELQAATSGQKTAQAAADEMANIINSELAKGP